MSFKGALGHFKTITKHRHAVIRHCAKAGIFWQGLFHDLSKYSLTEFIPGAKYYVGTRSPNELEREEKGFSIAWIHHKGRNRHHFEYWTDYNPKTKQNEPVKMPLRFVMEMVCDRIAASKIYQGKNYTDKHPLEYFMRGKPTRVIHKETSDLVEKLLILLAEHGEEVTFTCMKELLKEKKY
ncbi:MAG: catalase [Ruminococcaceae bacterium]|nr:catalase [Oscillospiraceae bacterium]